MLFSTFFLLANIFIYFSFVEEGTIEKNYIACIADNPKFTFGERRIDSFMTCSKCIWENYNLCKSKGYTVFLKFFY